MSREGPGEITRLLNRLSRGDKDAESKVAAAIYPDLKRLASSYLRGERKGHTLQTTALVNEAFLRIFTNERVQWQSRTHFIATAATLMRRILVDHARARLTEKRGGGRQTLSLDEALVYSDQDSAQLVVLDQALDRLAKRDARASRVVELRFFGGMTVEETAEALGVGETTVKRDWQAARVWLYGELSKSRNNDTEAMGAGQGAV